MLNLKSCPRLQAFTRNHADAAVLLGCHVPDRPTCAFWLSSSCNVCHVQVQNSAPAIPAKTCAATGNVSKRAMQTMATTTAGTTATKTAIGPSVTVQGTEVTAKRSSSMANCTAHCKRSTKLRTRPCVKGITFHCLPGASWRRTLPPYDQTWWPSTRGAPTS